MNNEKMNQIIDEAYKNYKIITHDKNEKNGNFGEYSRFGDKPLIAGFQHLTKSSFVQMCKTDTEFSKKWGLRIEERELADEERVRLYEKKQYSPKEFLSGNLIKMEDIPTKLITITYNNKKTEIYE